MVSDVLKKMKWMMVQARIVVLFRAWLHHHFVWSNLFRLDRELMEAIACTEYVQVETVLQCSKYARSCGIVGDEDDESDSDSEHEFEMEEESEFEAEDE